MTGIKIQHILTLVHLLSKGAKHNFVSMTTSKLGDAIEKSQQAASEHLRELEKMQLIQRISNGRNFSVKITPKGYNELNKLRKTLDAGMDSAPGQIALHGKVASGMGEGMYYMSRKGYTKQFKSNIGYVPFAGTLNIMLDKKEDVEAVRHLDTSDGVLIDGFSDGKRTYGWVRCFAAKINTIDCHLIRLERTHHDPGVIEVISAHNIRKTARLADGSKVTIKVTV